MMNNISHEAKKAVCYLRVSTEEQLLGTSLDGQKEACLLKAAGMGAQVAAVCTDAGVSGIRYTSRPGIQEALRLIEAGEANVLIAKKIDRIGRDARIILDIVRRVHQAGGDVMTEDATIDKSPMGQMYLTMLAGMAQMERETIRERTKGGAIRRAQAGSQPQRSRSPFGLHVVKKTDKENGLYPDSGAGSYVLTDAAPIVVEMFTRYAGGQSLREVCRWLNENGVGTQFGGAYWRPSQLKKVLVNPCYKGAATYGKHLRRAEEKGERTILHLDIQTEHLSIDCPALVSELVWRQVQSRIGEARAVFGGNPERRHLLGGLLRCPICGRGMTGTRRDKPTHGGKNIQHVHIYNCPDSRASRNPGKFVCNRKAYQAHHAEPIILRGIADVSRRPELVSAALAAYRRQESAGYDPKEHGRVETALRALDAKERATIDAQVAGIQAGANPAAYTSAFVRIGEERASLTARLRVLKSQAGQEEGQGNEDDILLLAEAMIHVEIALKDPELTDAQKHGLLARVIEKVLPEGEDAYRVYLRGLDGVEKGHSVKIL